MGKSLIIPGADFSQNNIRKYGEWLYSLGENYTETKEFPITTYYWSTYRIYNSVKGKTIKAFKIINPGNTGTVYLAKSQVSLGQPLLSSTFIEEFNVSQLSNEVIFELTTPITLTEQETLSVRVSSIGLIRYMQPNIDFSDEYYISDEKDGSNTSTVTYGIDFYGY